MALSSATQHAMPPELGGKWGTEYLNTRFPLPTLLCAGYSVKQKNIYILLRHVRIIIFILNNNKVITLLRTLKRKLIESFRIAFKARHDVLPKM